MESEPLRERCTDRWQTIFRVDVEQQSILRRGCCLQADGLFKGDQTEVAMSRFLEAKAISLVTNVRDDRKDMHNMMD